MERVLAHSSRVQSITVGKAAGSCLLTPGQVHAGVQLAFSFPFDASEDLCSLDGAPTVRVGFPSSVNLLWKVPQPEQCPFGALVFFHPIKLTIEMIDLERLVKPEVRCGAAGENSSAHR